MRTDVSVHVKKEQTVVQFTLGFVIARIIRKMNINNYCCTMNLEGGVTLCTVGIQVEKNRTYRLVGLS